MPEALSQVQRLLRKQGFRVTSAIDLQKQYRLIGLHVPARVVLSVMYAPGSMDSEESGRTFPCSVVLSEEKEGIVVSTVIPRDLAILARQVSDTEYAISALFQKLKTLVTARIPCP